MREITRLFSYPFNLVPYGLLRGPLLTSPLLPVHRLGRVPFLPPLLCRRDLFFVSHRVQL